MKSEEYAISAEAVTFPAPKADTRKRNAAKTSAYSKKPSGYLETLYRKPKINRAWSSFIISGCSPNRMSVKGEKYSFLPAFFMIFIRMAYFVYVYFASHVFAGTNNVRKSVDFMYQINIISYKYLI